MSIAIDDQIEVIESGYEFLLAYAAQGRADDSTPSGNSEIRTTLAGMQEAARNIANSLDVATHDFAPVIVDDARKSVAALSLVLAQDKIGSELVDNLNASIHVRALLTDLFLVSEAGID